MKRLLPAMLLALCLPVAAVAAVAAATPARPMLFEHLTSVEGLPQGTVYASLQDSTGFMWFGTEDGLVRYDGHDIHRYAFDPGDRDGLPNNFIFQIVEDRQSNLWVAMKGAGVARWNRATDTFTTFRHAADDPASISSDQIRTLMIDSRDRLWIGTLDCGVDILETSSGKVTHLRHEAGQSESLINDQVYALFEDRRGEVWIGTNSGIDRWTFSNDGLKRSAYLGASQGLLAGQDVQQIIDGNDGTLWAATFETGLYHLDYSGHVLDNRRHGGDPASSLSSNEVHAILDDHAGNVWIGSAGGLDSLNRGSGRISHYEHDQSDPASLTDSFVMSLYEDRAGLIWIGTRAGGVNRWNSQSWNFGGSNPAWLDGKLITAFADSGDDNLWVGTLGGGLYNFDTHTGNAASLDAMLKQKKALGDDRVMSLRRDRSGALWIGTWGAGVKRLGVNGELSSIPVEKGEAHSLSAPGIVAIYEARDGLLWIGTHGGGANILNPATGAVRQLPGPENVTAFLEDRAGFMWIGTDSAGLNLARSDGSVVRTFTHDPADPASLSANTIYALAQDADGNVWVSTDGGGLELISGSPTTPSTIRFQRFWHEQGLSSDTIYAAVPAANGQLWLSGNAGLMRFDPHTHAVTTFHREHGLQSEEFNSFAYFLTRDGRLAFGGTGGLNLFDPAHLAADSPAPHVALTGVEVLGASVHGAVPSWQLSQVRLDYRASVVSFDFAALDFKSPMRNRLAYRMSGITDKWIDLNTQHRVTLTNLDSGDHILEVRAANADSNWSTTPYRLNIRKAPAPWQSATAYALYAVLAAALGLWVVRTQRSSLRRALAAQQHLEAEVALRTKELREANRQLIVAGEAKSDFLSRMSHELRTPMNGVLGMTELLFRAPLPAAQARQVGTIRSSAQTLLQILNDLLDLSKAQAGKIVLESLPVDLNLLLEETVAMFSGAAEAKRLGLFVCPGPCNDHHVYGDPLRIRQVVMNLVGNAIKFTEHGEVVVTCDLVGTHAAAPSIRISVADTGVGISSTAIGRIFEPFTQADETTTRRFGGTGLGLTICLQLVELMGGTIKVDSRLHGGSTFTVDLPLRLERAATGSAAAGPDRTVVIVTRRTAFAESLQRYAALLGCRSRVEQNADCAGSKAREVVFVDVDSHPGAVTAFATATTSGAAFFFAASPAIEEHKLEQKVPESHLLRYPMTKAVLEAAIAAAAGPHSDAAWRQPPPLIAAGRHVLVVEDDPVNATVALGYLAALGCTSIWVADGTAAIARDATERFDLILMDLNMPGLDGYATAEAMRRGRRTGPRIPIVALTANNASGYRDACLAAGMDDIMSKPYTLAECAALLSRWTTPAANHAAMMKLAAIDAARVAGFHGIGHRSGNGLYVKLVALFRQGAPGSIATLGEALAQQNLPSARAAAHKFKGASANVGALAFSEALGKLEDHCAHGDSTRAQATFELLAPALPLLLENLSATDLRESA